MNKNSTLSKILDYLTRYDGYQLKNRMKKGARELSGFFALGRVFSLYLSPDDFLSYPAQKYHIPVLAPGGNVVPSARI